MTRPRKCRRVGFVPDNQCFHPQLRNTEEVVLNVEEVESIRLADYLSLEQDLAADSMNVSRGTFQRIVSSARKKVADAIIHGKTLRIDGGSYLLTSDKPCCRRIQGSCRRMDCEKCEECIHNKTEVNENE